MSSVLRRADSGPHPILLFEANQAISRALAQYLGLSKPQAGAAGQVAISGAPLLLNELLRPFAFNCDGGFPVLWLSYFGVLTAAALFFGRGAWVRLRRAGRAIDEAIKSLDERERMGLWLEKAFSRRLQAGVLVVGVIGSLFVLVVIEAELSLFVDICAASYLAVAILGGVSATVLYGLTVGVLAILRFCKIRDLKLREFDPAGTPAIRQLSELAATVAFWGGIGILLALAPILFAFTRPVRAAELDWAALVVTVVATAVVAFEGAASQWWLSRVVSAKRTAALDRLAEAVPWPERLRTEAERKTAGDAIRLYRLTLAARSSTVRIEVILETGLGVVAVGATILTVAVGG